MRSSVLNRDEFDMETKEGERLIVSVGPNTEFSKEDYESGRNQFEDCCEVEVVCVDEKEKCGGKLLSSCLPQRPGVLLANKLPFLFYSHSSWGDKENVGYAARLPQGFRHKS